MLVICIVSPQIGESAVKGPLRSLVFCLFVSKGGVVLAECQPLTDRQIQQNLLREMEELCITATDADTEPSSPTRLLHNIERQVGERNQFTPKANMLSLGKVWNKDNF